MYPGLNLMPFLVSLTPNISLMSYRSSSSVPAVAEVDLRVAAMSMALITHQYIQDMRRREWYREGDPVMKAYTQFSDADLVALLSNTHGPDRLRHYLAMIGFDHRRIAQFQNLLETVSFSFRGKLLHVYAHF